MTNTIMIITFIMLAFILSIINGRISQNYMKFDENDNGLMLPIKNQTIPYDTLVIILCISYAIALIITKNDIHKTIKLLIIGLCIYLITYHVTGILKKYVGRPRPSALTTCNYVKSELSNNINNCMNKNEIDESWSSFPSGHTSESFAVMVLIFFILNEYTDYNIFIKMLPILFASMVGITRIIDNRHHPTDVIGGAIIGTSISAAIWMLR